MRKIVLFSCLALSTPALSQGSAATVVLHEQCRAAIERETPFTTEEHSDGLSSIAASFEEMKQARAHARIKPLQFLSEEEFVTEVSERANTSKIVTTMFNGYTFSIASKDDGAFVQVVLAGKPCGVWEVTKKPM